MRVVPPYRRLGQALPRRMRWTRQRPPTRRRVPRLYRPEGRRIVRPSARVSLLHLASTVGLIVVVWAVGTLFQTFFAARVYPHITIDHVPVGGMTREDAIAALNDTETARVHQPIFVRVGAQSFQVTPARFGTRYDVVAAVDRALAFGHAGTPLVDGWSEVSTIARGANLPLTGTYDRGAIVRFLDNVERKTHVAPLSAVVGVRGVQPVILRDPMPGQRLDVAGAMATLSRVVDTHDAAAVTLPLLQANSALGYPEANAALAQARALLAAPITFQYTAQNRWNLTPDNIARLLSFTPQCRAQSCRFILSIDAARLAQTFQRGGVSRAVESPPSPATYQFYFSSNGPVVNVVADSSGTIINTVSAANLVLQQAAIPPGSPRVVTLPTNTTHASFTTQDAENLNFAVNVGSSASTDVLSPARTSTLGAAQLHNLDVAGSLVNTRQAPPVVQPGQTVDLSALVGPLDATNAYSAGLNTVDAHNITGINGGVEQFASAVLAAAYDAGLPIVQRDHYPYLTVFTPPGLDAVLGDPTPTPTPTPATARKGARGRPVHVPDLVFRNTTGHALLIQVYIDSSQTVRGVYLFNARGYAPARQQSAAGYDVTDNGGPLITLNPDGSVDVVRSRTITVNGRSTTDSMSGHYTSLDP